VPRGLYEKAAVERGMRGVLFINREAGGQLLARTGAFSGEPLKIPVYSLAQEEGKWIGTPSRARPKGPLADAYAFALPDRRDHESHRALSRPHRGKDRARRTL